MGGHDGAEYAETKLNGVLPLRMLLQEEILYLLAENPNAETMDDSIQLVPLHRILTAKSSLGLNDTSLEPDLAQQFALGMEGSLRLVMRVKRPLAEALFNRPIGRDQKIALDEEKPGRYLVSTYIDNSPQLKRWLRRRIDEELEILEPSGLF
jgi:hypothetical protein